MISDPPSYIHLACPSGETSSLAKSERNLIADKWACRECGHPVVRFSPIDIIIQGREPKPSPISFVYGYGIVLVVRKFVDQLIESGISAEAMKLGAVTSERKGNLSEWCTVRTQNEVILRATDRATFRKCPTCHRVFYSAQGERYITTDLPDDVSIATTDLMGLLVRRSVADQLDLDRWSALDREPIHVESIPLDGLPVDLQCKPVE